MTDDEKIQAEVGRIMALPDHEQVDAIVGLIRALPTGSTRPDRRLHAREHKRSNTARDDDCEPFRVSAPVASRSTGCRRTSAPVPTKARTDAPR